MCEAVHLPSLTTLPISVEKSLQPKVLRAHWFGKQKSVLDAIFVRHVPEHFEHLLLFGAVGLSLERV